MRKLLCPRCGTETVYAPANKWRPFCSERCKMIDLGLWGSDAYRLPDKEEPSSKPPES